MFVDVNSDIFSSTEFEAAHSSFAALSGNIIVEKIIFVERGNFDNLAKLLQEKVVLILMIYFNRHL